MTKEELLKYARPIFFNNDMVRATLEGRKTVFRKLIKCTLPESDCIIRTRNSKPYVQIHGTYIVENIQVPYAVGDLLYVKENWTTRDYTLIDGVWSCSIVYMNGESPTRVFWGEDEDSIFKKKSWQSSVCMPKSASRLILRVKNIRMESLDEIDGEEAVKEGFTDKYYCDGWYSFEPVKQFIDYWDWEYIKHDSDRHYYGYYASPWVWVVDFEVVEYD